MPRRSAAMDLNLGLRGVPGKESFSIVTASISSINTLIIFNGTQRFIIILQLYIFKLSQSRGLYGRVTPSRSFLARNVLVERRELCVCV